MSFQFFLALSGVLLGILAILWVQDLIRRRHLMLRVQKMYCSSLYQDMRPFLHTIRDFDAECITIDKTGIVARFFNTDLGETAFMMQATGHPYLTEEKQEALRVILEDRIPALADSRRYCLQRFVIPYVTGEKEYGYRYTMTPRRKSELTDPVYFGNNVHTGLW